MSETVKKTDKKTGIFKYLIIHRKEQHDLSSMPNFASVSQPIGSYF